MARKSATQPTYKEKHLSVEEMESGIRLLNKRLEDIRGLVAEQPQYDSPSVAKVQTKLTETIATIFGDESRRVAEVPDLARPLQMYSAMATKEENHQKFLTYLPKRVAWVESLIESLEEQLEERKPVTKTEDQDLWSLIHPIIYKLCKKKFDDTHYADSVETAMKAVNERVKAHYKKQSGVEDDGASLMQKALSPNAPVIVMGDQATESGRNEQKGYMFIFAGAMQGIRNPKAHANLDIDATRAMHQLFLASLLMYKLDEAGVR